MSIARPVCLAALVASVVLLEGCVRYRVVVPEPNPATDYESATMHAYLWGAVEETLPTENCVDNLIDEVRVVHTFPNLLVSALSLGVYMPMRVEWRCAKRPQSPGSGF